jgi:hypothetical protein
MSYDVWVQDLPAGLQSLDDIPDDFVPAIIGSRADIISKIMHVVPSADFSDPARGRVDGPDFWIEVGMSEEQAQCCHFALGGSDAAVGVVSEIIAALGLPALHCGGDGMFRREDALAGIREWRRYRNQIVAEGEPSAV